MLKTKFLCRVGDDGITAILPIHESAKLIVSKKSGDVLVYSRDGSGLKLFQTYHKLLHSTHEDLTVNALFYSAGLSTVFAQSEKTIALLNSSNLNQFDKIVDKRGIRQCWVFEKPTRNETSKTVLVYLPKKVSKLKMFIWKGHSFKTVQEATLTSKDELVSSIELGSHGLYITSNIGVYYWRLQDFSLIRVDKIVAPNWPRDLQGALKELEQYVHQSHDSNDANSKTNYSVITRKTSLTSFFQRVENKHKISRTRFLFHPDDRRMPVLIDGRTEKLFEISIGESHQPFLTAYDHSSFAQLNREFDRIQFLTTRFLLLSNSHSFRIVDYLNGYNYLDLTINDGIKQIVGTAGTFLIVWTGKDDIELYKLYIMDDSDIPFGEDDSLEIEDNGMVRSLKKIVFCEAILSPDNQLALCEDHNCDDVDGLLDLYALKLRDLTVLWCLRCFEQCNKWFGCRSKEHKTGLRFVGLQELIIKHIFDKFISFLAPPELVISHCFPLDVIRLVDDATTSNYSFNKDENIQSIPPMYINKWCLPYLTDMRRILRNLSREKSIKWSLNNRDIIVGIEFFQVDQHKELDVQSLLTIIDTALFKLYLDYNPVLVGPFTRVENMCDFETVVNELSSHQMIHELVDFYYHRQKHELALSLLTHLEQRVNNSKAPDDFENNIKALIIDYLSKLPDDFLDTIFEYTNWLLQKFPLEKDVIISSVFMNQTTNCSNFNYFKVYDFIDLTDKAVSLRYLEFVIDTFQSQDKKLYMILIRRYLENLGDTRTSKKLHAVLRNTHLYEPRTVYRLLCEVEEKDELDPMQMQSLQILKTYPLKRLGDHERALNILFDKLGNYSLSSSYCNDVYVEDQTMGTKLLMQFFDKILKMTENSNPNSIISFLQEHGSKVDEIKILNKLPKDLLLKDLSQILSHRLKSLSVEKNDLRIKRNLLQVELVDKSYQLNCKLSEYVTVGEERKCFVCHKVLKSNPSDIYFLFDIDNKSVVTHYNCGKSLQETRSLNRTRNSPKKAGEFLKSI